MAPMLPLAVMALFASAAVTDLRSRRIPNGLSLMLAVLGLVRIGLDVAAGGSLTFAAAEFLGAAGVFLLGALAFHLNALGGGDVKLIGAGALWFGLAGLGPFLLSTAIAGGLLALAFVGGRFAFPRGSADAPASPLPYAVAIAAGAVLTISVSLWA